MDVRSAGRRQRARAWYMATCSKLVRSPVVSGYNRAQLPRVPDQEVAVRSTLGHSSLLAIVAVLCIAQSAASTLPSMPIFPIDRKGVMFGDYDIYDSSR